MTWELFDKYLEDQGDFGECISNHKNKIVVYKEEIEGSLYYIKKYIPYGKRKIRVAFGLLNDRSKHYRKVTNILEKIKIRLLSGIEVNESDFNFMKLNANLFKGIKFIKKRKAKKKWQMLKSRIKK